MAQAAVLHGDDAEVGSQGGGDQDLNVPVGPLVSGGAEAEDGHAFHLALLGGVDVAVQEGQHFPAAKDLPDPVHVLGHLPLDPGHLGHRGGGQVHDDDDGSLPRQPAALLFQQPHGGVGHAVPPGRGDGPVDEPRRVEAEKADALVGEGEVQGSGGRRSGEEVTQEGPVLVVVAGDEVHGHPLHARKVQALRAGEGGAGAQVDGAGEALVGPVQGKAHVVAGAEEEVGPAGFVAGDVLQHPLQGEVQAEPPQQAARRVQQVAVGDLDEGEAFARLAAQVDPSLAGVGGVRPSCRSRSGGPMWCRAASSVCCSRPTSRSRGETPSRAARAAAVPATCPICWAL